MKIKNYLIYCLIFIVMFCFTNNVKAVYSDDKIGNYETELAKFPSDFKNKIETLHKLYPNAIFVAQDKFFDWSSYKEVTVNWNNMLSSQLSGSRSLIYYTADSKYKGASYDGTWYYATKEAIEYYMNPKNFLNEKHVFMFESQYYKDYHILDGVNKILSGTFMADKKCDGSDKTYAEVIMEAAQLYNVSPYMLAARLKQEQGTKGTSSLISGTYKGYENLYNYFNVSASGNTTTKVITSGLTKAREMGWTTPYLSIIGGSKFIYKEYIGINDTYNVRGQMTNYLQKWDPYGPKYGGHQYMQNITAPVTEAVSTYNSYSSFNGYKNYKYIFYIPIYQNRPDEGLDEEIKATGYKISDSYISGININTTQETFINNVKKTLSSASVTITKNSNNKTNNLATGDTIKIVNNNETKIYNVVIYGDVNGDGSIKATDYVKIKNHIMGSGLLNNSYKTAADINKDGSVKATDYVLVKNSIMGTYKISQ